MVLALCFVEELSCLKVGFVGAFSYQAGVVDFTSLVVNKFELRVVVVATCGNDFADSGSV